MQKFSGIVRQKTLWLNRRLIGFSLRLYERLGDQKGQGTTEYAILVGVLVVIAILAIVAFRPKIEQLWRAITDALEQL